MIDESSLRVKLSDPASGERSPVWIAIVGRRRSHSEGVDERERTLLLNYLYQHSTTASRSSAGSAILGPSMIMITSVHSYTDMLSKDMDLK
jgi:hypothetical protein